MALRRSKRKKVVGNTCERGARETQQPYRSHAACYSQSREVIGDELVVDRPRRLEGQAAAVHEHDLRDERREERRGGAQVSAWRRGTRANSL